MKNINLTNRIKEASKSLYIANLHSESWVFLKGIKQGERYFDFLIYYGAGYVNLALNGHYTSSMIYLSHLMDNNERGFGLCVLQRHIEYDNRASLNEKTALSSLIDRILPLRQKLWATRNKRIAHRDITRTQDEWRSDIDAKFIHWHECLRLSENYLQISCRVYGIDAVFSSEAPVSALTDLLRLAEAGDRVT